MSNIDKILAERAQTHGSFKEHAAVTQELKDAMRRRDGWAKLTHSQREALEMVAHKIGRILSGNPHFEDHWDDCQGYLRLVSIELGQAHSWRDAAE